MIDLYDDLVDVIAYIDNMTWLLIACWPLLEASSDPNSQSVRPLVSLLLFYFDENK